MIGHSVTRRDALEKSRGRACYVDDLHPEGAWHGVTLRSPVARGVVQRLAPGPDFPCSDAVCVTAAGLGERNRVAMIADDMPFLADAEVRYVGEPLALVAAPTRALARRAARAIRVEIEERRPMLQLSQAVAGWRRDRQSVPVFAAYRIQRGDPSAALAQAGLVVEGRYTTPPAEQAYIEPQGMIAWPRGRGVVVEGSLQCPYYVHPALVRLLGCTPDEVIVRQTVTGGAFGGKEDFPSLLAGHAALLAQACQRPVKMVYSRNEDLLFTPKRHPSIVRHRTGVSADGRLQAMEIELFLDGGAYTTLSPVVLARAVLTATGPYDCPHVGVHGVCLGTDTPPYGAYRGFGAPQVSFAGEVQMDRVAERVGLRPDILRRRNLVRVGSVTATGQVLRESVGAEQVLDEALRVSGFVEAWERARAELGNERRAPGGELPGMRRGDDSPPAPRKQRGIGLALVWHGSGFTGSGEQQLASRAALTVEPDDRLCIRVSNVDMGQGTSTALPQIVADRLGIDLACVYCARPDTSEVPNSGPTVASRTIMIVGGLLADCADQLGAALCRATATQNGIASEQVVWREGAAWGPATPHPGRRPPSPPPCTPDPGGRLLAELPAALSALRASSGALRFEAVYRVPDWLHWNEERFEGDAYATFGYACTVAEVEVDRETSELVIPRIVAVCDVGRAINPLAVEGQIEGGVLQGVGYATLEQLELQSGRYAQQRFQTFLIPTALDAPRIEAQIVEVPYSGGPGGAKGMAEMPISGPAPAIANAVTCACGLAVSDLPITPERLHARRRPAP